ncbi:BTAD domain-containing putative transcriptional regulator [Nocardioides gansuensis]|uniref:BTAD domain-containing putative transcriptional regulator n=1 Tax=Nocardioides gansuensis TaxID=2138300 RepID=UPI001402990D|nr:BTAD domain-containing putative transcriptional regulator [Nocardioides gansuensis]
MGAQDDGPPDVEVRLLGPIDVRRGGRALDVPGGRARSLLTVLALQAGQAIPAERLIDTLWGDEVPTTAKTVLQGFVSKLRKTLGATALETTGNGYRLAVSRSAIDANRFHDLVTAARDLDGEERTAALEQALGLWRGPALSDVAYEPFAQAAIAALEEHRLAAREALIGAQLDTGMRAELVPQLEDLIADNPFREHLRELLVLALYRAGRQADALAAYQQARQTLIDELGLEPGPELRMLHERILNQDPGLDAPAPSASRRAERSTWFPSERRTVTVLFVDVTATDADLDPEAGETIAVESLARVTEALRSNGARIQESGSGIVIGWFGLPSAHEDDPLRAVLAAAQARQRVLALPGPSRDFRAGLETGEVVSGVTDSRASGPAVSVAARLQQGAQPGEVLIGPRAMKVLRGAAIVERARELASTSAWRLVDVDPQAKLISRDFQAHMVGREAELTLLRTSFGRMVRRGTPQRMTVLGEAGIGKSRLSRAFADSIGGRARTITATCVEAGSGRTFGLLHDLLVQAGGGSDWKSVVGLLEEKESGLGDRLAGVLGLGDLKGPPQLFFGDLRRAFELLSAVQPLAVIVDDVHWAESTLLDLFEYLSDSLTGPVFLLLLARPELVERRAEWSVGGERKDVLYLDPLGVDAIAQVLWNHASVDLPPEDEQRIVETAQGNPLFAEQLLAAFANAETDAIPASLRGLLATRIDRLGPGERDLLRAAAVAGDHLSVEAIEVLAPDEARPFLARNMESLARKRLLRHTEPNGVEFPHGLIRDAAYQSLTRRDRACLHLAFADWLERTEDPPRDELDAVVGHHLEQAVVNQRQVGLASDAALEARAGTKLASAGFRAYSRMDMWAASNLLVRALGLLPDGHPLVPTATQRLAEVSLPLGDHARAQELLLQLSNMPSLEPVDRWLARLENARSMCITGPHGMTADDLVAIARQAAAFFSGAGHDNGLAQAIFLLGWLEQRGGNPVDAVDSGRRSLECAQRGGAVREQLAAAFLISRSLLGGPTPVPDCIEEIESLMGQSAQPHPIVMGILARAHAMTGDFDGARQLLARARPLLIERMRVRRLLAFIAWDSAEIETLADKAAAAVSAYRVALTTFRNGNEAEHVGETSSRLALVLAAEEHPEEARALANEAHAVTPTDCVVVRALAMMATARSMPLGDIEASLAQAAAAVNLAPDLMPNLKADLLVEQSRVQAAAGLAEDARSSIDTAISLYQRKGNVAALRRLRA